MNGKAKIGVGLIFLVLLVLVVSVAAQEKTEPVVAGDFKVHIVSEYHGLTNHRIVFEIQNLLDTKEDFNLQVYFQNATFNIDKLSNVMVYEWVPVTKEFTEEVQVGTEKSICYWPDNSPYPCDKPITQTNMFIADELDWKIIKPVKEVKDELKKEKEVGLIELPRLKDKCKTDDFETEYECNGTRLFKATWTTPIDWNSGWGSSGYYGISDLNTGYDYDPWWNASITYRQALEINSSMGDIHSGLPVLVNGTSYIDLSDLINNSKLDVNAYCLWFINGSATPTEVSWHWANRTSTTYGYNTSTAEIWINGSANATYYMYYDNACGASSGSWDDTVQTDTNLKAWWHAAEENDELGNYTNESAQAIHNGSLTTTYWDTGKIGYSIRFANTGCVNCGDHADWDTDAFTVEGWAYRTAACSGDYPGVYSKGGNQYFLKCTPTTSVFMGYLWQNPVFQTKAHGTVPAQDTWFHWAHTYNGSQHCVWINGDEDCDPETGSITTDNNPFELGSYFGCGNGNREFAGKLDEITMSSVYRSHAWINFRADGSPSSLGTEETASAGDTTNPVVNLTSPLNHNITGSNNVTFTCNATDETGLGNISLWGNWSGTWVKNQTKTVTGTAASAEFYPGTIAPGVYGWNCSALDNSSNVDFSDTNWTFEIDTSGPSIDFVAPTFANLTTMFTNYIEVNVSCNMTISTCLLEWEGTNVSMTEGSNWCYANRTGLAQGDYYFRVWANRSWDNWNVSYGRQITYINSSAPGGGGGGVTPPPGTECQNYTFNNFNISAGGLIGELMMPFSISIYNGHVEQKFSAFFTGEIEDYCIFTSVPVNATPPNGIATFVFECTAPNGTALGRFVFRTDTGCRESVYITIYGSNGFFADVQEAIAKLSRLDWRGMTQPINLIFGIVVPFWLLLLLIIIVLIIVILMILGK